MQRKGVANPKSPMVWKVAADEMIGVPVPRKARSASMKRSSHEWSAPLYFFHFFREQEKAFENALATTEEEEGDAMWEKIAEAVEGKTAEEVRQHYELLVEVVDGIESGRVLLPVYAGDGDAEEGSGGGGKKGLVLGSWFLVLGSWFLVLGSWFLVLGAAQMPQQPKGVEAVVTSEVEQEEEEAVEGEGESLHSAASWSGGEYSNLMESSSY